MILSQDLSTGSELLLLAADTKLTLPLVHRVQSMGKTDLLFSSVFVKATPPTEEDLEEARRQEAEPG